jgi:hypothetical protein
MQQTTDHTENTESISEKPGRQPQASCLPVNLLPYRLFSCLRAKKPSLGCGIHSRIGNYEIREIREKVSTTGYRTGIKSVPAMQPDQDLVKATGPSRQKPRQSKISRCEAPKA